MDRLREGEGGKTVDERVRGKKANVIGSEFGEKVLYKIKLGAKMEKVNPRWEHGIFVGIRKGVMRYWYQGLKEL